jgi:hypothetical protein
MVQDRNEALRNTAVRTLHNRISIRMYEDHLKTCRYCQNSNSNSNKNKVSTPTIFRKSASSYYREKKLAELGAVNRGVFYSGISYVGEKKINATRTKAASSAERQFKLRDLGKIVRGI